MWQENPKIINQYAYRIMSYLFIIPSICKHIQVTTRAASQKKQFSKWLHEYGVQYNLVLHISLQLVKKVLLLSDDNNNILFKVRITSMGILNICNLWILLRKIVIHKLTEVMSQRESLYMKTSLQIPAMTLLRINSTLTAKKSPQMTFPSDKIYYNFSQENPKITNI